MAFAESPEQGGVVLYVSKASRDTNIVSLAPESMKVGIPCLKSLKISTNESYGKIVVLVLSSSMIIPDFPAMEDTLAERTKCSTVSRFGEVTFTLVLWPKLGGN
jgi:hypothetical protein